MGRHGNTRGGITRRARWPAALVVGLVVAAGAVGWRSGIFFGDTDPAAGRCDEPTAITVAADPSIAPALNTVARTFDEGACTRTTVRAKRSVDTSTALAQGSETDVDAWVPRSTVWLDAAMTGEGPELTRRGLVATSPVVFAVAEDRADAVEDDLAWSSLVGGDVRAVLPDPEVDAAGTVGLLALRSELPPDDPRPFAAAVIELSRAIPASVEAAFDDAATAADPTVVVTTEQAVVVRNSRAPDAPRLRALYPSDGTLSVPYPFVLTGTPGAGGADRPDAATLDAFRRAVLDAGATFAAAGFRDATGSGGLDATGVRAASVDARPVEDPAEQTEILTTWTELTLRSRILTVIDVSGSMSQDAGGGLRRIDVFQRAAVGVLDTLPVESEMGVWVFSTERSGGKDWQDLAPIEALGDPVHALALGQLVTSLPERVQGGTALYDTTLAAVRRLRETYDPDKKNFVLLITDGRNEDDIGLDLPTLLTELRGEKDPARPVEVLIIGFGPDTDIDAMRQITEVTGGAAYTALTPADLADVLVEAVSQRSCRPNC